MYQHIELAPLDWLQYQHIELAPLDWLPHYQHIELAPLDWLPHYQHIELAPLDWLPHYQLLVPTLSALSNLERMVQDIEFVQIEMKVIEGLKVGNDCLKSMHEAMSLEDVERIMDETQDAIEYQRQIDELLSGSLTQEDEDAVLSELEAITQGEDVELPEVPTEPLPEVPEPAETEPERRPARNKENREMLAA
uniref:charged multivesicular body protein 6-like n=1 Tax=Oncorhynchus gorbuscha TaxID=8017 RepID=UPI001EAEA739|nr:charged multivesicular body protein 6-like [Oncorhynchus gorbuscha]